MNDKSYTKRETLGWTYFSKLDVQLDSEKVGKWMYYFNDYDYTYELCDQAVASDVIERCKLTSRERLMLVEQGVACFYLNIDDKKGHERLIAYFIKHNMIKKKKNGDYYNISFKLDKQTRNNEYGHDYNGILKLEDLMNLKTGEWLV